MKSRGHVYMANLLLKELREQKGFVTLRSVPDEHSKVETLRYQVPEQIYHAIINHPSCFRAGAVGPDFFPDLITGQMTIHPTHSGKFLEMMFEELRKIHPYSDEFEKALAFYMGWMMHYCGDMYSHQAVNLYAFGWFPSLYELYENANALFLSPIANAVMDYLKRHLTEEELDELYAEPSVARLTQLLLDDPAASEELAAAVEGLDKDGNAWDKIAEALEILVRGLLMVNSITNIVRHLTIEAHLDNTIDRHLRQWNDDLRNFYSLDIPHDFIRRCFTTPEAYDRMNALAGNEGGAEPSPVDVLGIFVARYEEEYRDLLLTNGDTRALEDLQLRERYLDKWVSFWHRFVQNDLFYGTPVPEGQKLDMYEEIAELFAAHQSEDVKDLKKVEALADLVNGLIGIFKTTDTIFEFVGIETGLSELLEMSLEMYLLMLLAPTVNKILTFAEPKVIFLAKALVRSGLVRFDRPIETLEDAVRVLVIAMDDVRTLLNCKALFGVEGLGQRLDAQWAKLGTRDKTCFDLDCPMLENALQMGKLCLMGSWELNRLVENNLAPGAIFHAKDVRWTISDMVLELEVLDNRFTHHDFTIVHEVIASDDRDQHYPAHVQTIWNGGRAKGIIKAELRLSEPLEVDKLVQCKLYVMRKGMNHPSETLRCKVRIYEKATGLLLFAAEHRMTNMAGTRYHLFEPDREANALGITEKMENAKRINSLSRVSVAVTTGTNGTDNTVQFCIAARPRLVDGKVDVPILRGPFSLDKSCYNDFESGDHDVYDISFDRIYDLDEIGGFIIKRKSGSDLLRLNHIWVRAADENNGDQVCLADADLKNVVIGTNGFIFSMNREALKAPELELVDENITRILVDIHTADVFLAGTDNDVFLEILSGSTVLRKLELDADRNDFERDRRDGFDLDIRDANGRGIQSGDITAFKLYKVKGSAQLDDDWEIDEVRISNYHGGRLLAHFMAETIDNRVLLGETDNIFVMDCRHS